MREWLETARIERRLSKAAVARKAQISAPFYWAIERGKSNPSPATAKKIAAVLGFDWTKFYE